MTEGGGPAATIRTARREDVPQIVRLLADDPFGKSREAFADPLPLDYWEAFEAVEASPNDEIVVMERGGAIVACMQITYIPGLSRKGALRAQFEGVRVSEDVRGSGLGRTLFEWAIDRAKTRGCMLVQLTTDKERGEAHRFYERLGFKATHEGMKLALDPTSTSAGEQ